MKKEITMVLVLMFLGTVFAQGKDAFMREQAYAVMNRVTGQIDVLQSNYEGLSARVFKLESGKDGQALRAEIDALKASIAEIRRELASQRGEIVKDISSRIAKMQSPSTPAPDKSAGPEYNGPCSEYIVQSGDTLSLIAQAFRTKVSMLKSMNGLKNDNLRIGQKLLVPRIKE